MTEIWLPVVGFEGAYEVSNLGRVRSLDRRISDAMGRTYIRPSRLLAGSSAAGRYAMFRLAAPNGDVTPCYLHDMVAAAFIGPKPAGRVTRHLDDNPDNNMPSNLRYGTHSENMRDAAENGRLSYGEAHQNAKFSNAHVLDLRGEKGRLTSERAAEIFGISARYVREIWAGEKRVKG